MNIDELKTAAKQGDVLAQVQLGVHYTEAEDYEEAVRWYRLAAEQREASDLRACAQNSLGHAYNEGLGVPKDAKDAVKWWRMAAEQGLAGAQLNLGNAYNNGNGVPEDAKEAVKWFRMAAEQGEAFAQHNLGNAYDKGNGVGKNMVEAVKWWRMAAEQGLAASQFNLANVYEQGDGVAENKEEALKWYRKLAEQDGSDYQARAQEKVRVILSRKDGCCYIATAVYGSYDAPEVLCLRQFRDETLSAFLFGRLFIRVYYFLSPPIARRLKNMRRTNAVVRRMLDVFIQKCLSI